MSCSEPSNEHFAYVEQHEGMGLAASDCYAQRRDMGNMRVILCAGVPKAGVLFCGA